jgi:K(+)-stimulated pyrophosphate-energized sodium pump
MGVATKANARTARAATKGMGPALSIAFAGGSVMGMTVVGLALLGISIILAAMSTIAGADAESLTAVGFPVLSGFSLGASTIALFARVGGGVYTKAADVGADLVGKVEVGIPEDDPRNPAVIADNVGDNVGDVAGMGADLFESYASSLIGCAVLGIGASAAADARIRLAFFPLFAAAIGVVTSLIGTLFVKMKPGSSPQKALNAGSFGAAGLAVALLFPSAYFVVGDTRFGGAAGTDFGWLGVAWDNAKKFIESRNVEGKGSNAHMSAVVGDTVGDPFKDTAGPSLNILIKLMAIIALVIAPLFRAIWR